MNKIEALVERLKKIPIYSLFTPKDRKELTQIINEFPSAIHQSHDELARRVAVETLWNYAQYNPAKIESILHEDPTFVETVCRELGWEPPERKRGRNTSKI